MVRSRFVQQSIARTSRWQPLSLKLRARRQDHSPEAEDQELARRITTAHVACKDCSVPRCKQVRVKVLKIGPAWLAVWLIFRERACGGRALPWRRCDHGSGLLPPARSRGCGVAGVRLPENERGDWLLVQWLLVPSQGS